MIDKNKLAKWLYDNDGRDKADDYGWKHEPSFIRDNYKDIATQLIKAIKGGELEPPPEKPCRHKFFSWGRLKMAGQSWSRRCQLCGYQEITYKNPLKE